MHRSQLVAVLALAAPAVAAPVPKAAKVDDATAILDRWRVESVHTGPTRPTITRRT
jgi:hypothetical protein